MIRSTLELHYIFCVAEHNRLLTDLLCYLFPLNAGLYLYSLSCVFPDVSHSKTKFEPETVSVDSLVFVKLIVVWSESSNTTQSIVATYHNELKKEN